MHMDKRATFARVHSIFGMWPSRMLAYVCCLLIVGVIAWPLPAQSQTVGTFLDQGGAVFNVKAYGATGNGATNDSPSVQNAVNAAIAAGGGVVYFPAGTYFLDAPKANATVAITNSRSDIVSLAGVGMGTQLKFNTIVGLSLPQPTLQNLIHGASIMHMQLACTSSTAGTAVQMTDLIGAAPLLYDLTLSGCNVGFDLVNQSYWTERLVAINITDNYNNHLFWYDQSSADQNNSYGYGTYLGIYTNKSAGQDVFYLTGGAYLYHSSFVIKGNFTSNASGAAIFNVQGGSGQPCPGAAYNTYDVSVEGASYSVVNSANNGCSGGATGNPIVSGSGSISATGAVAGTTSLIQQAGNLPYLAGTFTTTANTQDNLSSPAVSPGVQCFAQPANSVASGMIVGTYVSGVNWGTATVTHPGVAGGLFQVWCQ
jgi:hypothetical protein